MLVLDAFQCHLADSVKRLLRDSRTELIIIPEGMTSQLQPLDVCIIKPFKDHIRPLYREWMRSGEPEVTPDGRLKRASPALLCAWIAEAWACIPEARFVVPLKSAPFQTHFMERRMRCCGRTLPTRELRKRVRQTRTTNKV
ncbi:POGO family transposable element, putative [Ixodes scapularis]|uniref:POGO family transposable element, putative n=1 Tax=Ixodes scapularis TaxID=6945 RepID=B7PAN1_IXOSC|nr:POGO family transposable element, putative [Ixodes scapularis]|eukprot:XP_002407030.1 POGO family transposable element, putative [Ixodes scapularis]